VALAAALKLADAARGCPARAGALRHPICPTAQWFPTTRSHLWTPRCRWTS
jgi:hypothetical protein